MPPLRQTKRSIIGGNFITGDAPRKAQSVLSRGCDDASKLRQLSLRLQQLTSGSPVNASSTSSHEPGHRLVRDNEEHQTIQRRTEPDRAAISNNIAWKALIPSVVDDMLRYYASASASPIRQVSGTIHNDCSGACNSQASWTLTAYYYGDFLPVEVQYCKCRTLSQVLARSGLFPSAPSQPRMAFSIEMLDFYRALFHRSGDAVTAFSGAMHAFYTRRGFDILSNQGLRLQDPFRRSLGNAALWLESVHVMVDDQVDGILAAADRRAGPSRKECSRLLRNLCPACFGLDEFGRPFADGTDIHVATDGNFQHKHLVTGGQGIPTHDPRQILSKSFVKSVGERIDNARKSPPQAHSFRLPNEVVDQCESSYEAARGEQKRQHANGCRYDSVGWMVLTCRHDVPLALVDIDTPGERQMYAVALLFWLFDQLPNDATVTLLYDIGCVLHKSIHLYNILPPSIVARLQIAIAVMHAYGHQWACQLLHHPRFLEGLGLTDGECGERDWSQLVILIPIVRTCSLSKRADLTAQQIVYIAARVLCKLGEWISRRFKNGVEAQGSKARKILDDCPLSVEDLRKQWKNQKETQLSLSHQTQSPCLKKDLDHIKSLQTQMEGVEKAINDATSGLSLVPDIANPLQEKLSTMQAAMLKTTEGLCASLDLRRHFPALYRVDREFAQVLLLARDLKDNIRKRAIERLFELDRLDQAAGGKNPPLGTKLQRSIQKSIANRRPALKNAIDKYNQYCATLKRMYKPSFGLPLPNPLSTRLTDLREDPELLQDIWTTPSSGEPPLWLTSPQVRSGIRAALKIDRCAEEDNRLDRETRHMISWYTRELTAVELALVDYRGHPISFRLIQRRTQLIDLKAQWVHSLKGLYQFESRICMAEAEVLATLRLNRESV